MPSIFLGIVVSSFLFGIRAIFAWTECDIEGECNDQTLDDSIIFTRGYKSAMNSEITVKLGFTGSCETSTMGSSCMNCDGSHSCVESKLSAGGDTGITGAFAASEATINGVFVTVASAYGAMDAHVSAAKYIECQGKSSCIGAFISDTPTINAYGSFSLSNALISGHGAMTINFYGWRSGESSTIDCRSGDCTVNCWNENACVNTNCIGCNLNYVHSSSIDLQHFAYDDVFASAEDACNTGDAITYDDSGEHDDGDAVSSTSNVCCRSSTACHRAESISASDAVLCSGRGSCYGIQKFIDSNSILCGGLWSCAYSTLLATNIHCGGQRSCVDSSISIAANGFLECSSYRSCAGATISSRGTGGSVTIVFTGYQALTSTDITCQALDTCYIFILAQALGDGSITCHGKCVIECDEEWCPSITSDSPTPHPTKYPTTETDAPTKHPSKDPTFVPTEFPSVSPTLRPTLEPTLNTNGTVDDNQCRRVRQLNRALRSDLELKNEQIQNITDFYDEIIQEMEAKYEAVINDEKRMEEEALQS